MPPPLAGVRVVDFTELLPGPFLTQCMVDMGAHVIKVERPTVGDSARRLAPGLFRAVNRGKVVHRVDLKDASGVEAARDWVRSSDILVEGFRPGVMERIGLGYDVARSLKPSLVYVSLSGYGQRGPHAHEPGHDINYLARSGVLALSGGATVSAHSTGVPLADLCGSVYALSATLAALMQVRSGGTGQHLDVSLTDCVAHWLNPRLGHFQSDGVRSLALQKLDVFIKPAYGVFETADHSSIAIAALEDAFWESLRAALSLPFPAGMSYADRVNHADGINEALSKRVRSLAPQEALRRLKELDVPASELVLPSDLLATPHAVARGLADPAQPDLVRFPVRLEGMRS